jgi:hypothetical protein
VINLAIDATPSRPRVHESVRARVVIRNDSAAAVEVPRLDDRTDAYTFELIDEAGVAVRRLNGVTGQVMMSTNRVDWRPSLGLLAPGEAWEDELDLAQLHYLLPPGAYKLQLRLGGDGSERPAVCSNAVPLDIVDAPVGRVRVWRDDPVIDGIVLVIEGDRLYLRQHTAMRPLAAWYAREIGSPGPTVYARADFFDPSTFDAFDERVLATQQGRDLVVRTFYAGEPTAAPTTLALPPGRTLIDGAFRDEARCLRLFLAASGSIECYRLDQGGLALEFARPAAADAALCAIGGEIHMVERVGHALVHHRLRRDGTVLGSRNLASSRMKLASCRIDPSRRLVLACFADLPHGHVFDLLAVPLDNDPSARSRRLDDLQLGGDVREIAFDIDRAARFHLVLATSRRRLLYWADGRGPALVARQDSPFHPLIVTARKPYLGYYCAGQGYRFVELEGRHGRPRTVDYKDVGEP